MAPIGCRSGGGTVAQLAVLQMLREPVFLALERIDALARVRMGRSRVKTAESADPGVVRRTSLGHCALDGDPERCDERGSCTEIRFRLTALPIFVLYCFAHLTAVQVRTTFQMNPYADAVKHNTVARATVAGSRLDR
jgi:hypothetical protein